MLEMAGATGKQLIIEDDMVGDFETYGHRDLSAEKQSIYIYIYIHIIHSIYTRVLRSPCSILPASIHYLSGQ